MSGRHEHSELLIDVRDLTSNPMQYFREKPTAVHSDGNVLGYVIGVELFEQMINNFSSMLKLISVKPKKFENNLADIFIKNINNI